MASDWEASSGGAPGVRPEDQQAGHREVYGESRAEGLRVPWSQEGACLMKVEDQGRHRPESVRED